MHAPNRRTPDPLPHTLHRIAGVHVLRIESPSLSWRHASALRTLLAELSDRPLILDLEEVDFMDTAALVVALKAAREAMPGTELGLTNVGPGLQPLFRTMKVADRILLAERPEQAAGLLVRRKSA